MPLKPVYRGGGEKAIATYDYVDVAEGTGIVLYYGFVTEDSGGATYAISTNQTYTVSDKLYSSANTSGTSFTKILDMDFDLSTYNLPQRIKGTARFIYTLGVFSTSSSNSAQAYVTIKIRKWDGTTETEIANNTSQTETYPETAENWHTHNLEVPITSLTHFKKGETLRVTIEVYAKRTDSNERAITFYHDPQDLTDESAHGGDTTMFHLYIPYALDL